MAFTPQEQEIIKYGRLNGKSRAEVEEAVLRFRTGRPFSEAAPENSAEKDVAIGVGKGALEAVDFIGDMGLQSAARQVTPFVPPTAVKKVGDTAQAVVGLDEDLTKADNPTQQTGKYAFEGLSAISPFAISRIAKLASRGATAAKAAGDTVRVAIAKKSANPQLETSANRLFAKGTQRLADPLATYEKYLSQSKKAIDDVKADPAVAQVGESIGDAFNEIVKRRRTVGERMGEELKKVGGVKTNIDSAFSDFETALKESDLVYDGAKKKLVAGPASKMAPEDVMLVEDYVKRLNLLGTNPTISHIDAFIARTEATMRHFKDARNITETTNGERLIKQSLRSLRQQFDPEKTGNKALTAYAKARKEYADLSDFIDDGVGYLGKITQAGDFARDASLAKSAVQSVLNNGKKDWLIRLEELTGYPALDDSVLALQAMKDAGDFRGLSLLETLAEGSTPTSKAGITQKMIDYAFKQAARVVSGTPEEQTRAFLRALKEAAAKHVK